MRNTFLGIESYISSSSRLGIDWQAASSIVIRILDQNSTVNLWHNSGVERHSYLGESGDYAEYHC